MRDGVFGQINRINGIAGIPERNSETRLSKISYPQISQIPAELGESRMPFLNLVGPKCNPV